MAKMNLSSLYSLRMGSSRQGNEDTAIHVSLEIIKRELGPARNKGSLQVHAKAVLALASLISMLGRHHKRNKTAQAMARDLTAGLEPLPKWLVNYIRVAPARGKSPEVELIAGVGVEEWSSLVSRVQFETESRKQLTVDRLADATTEAIDLNAAARLSRRAHEEPPSPHEIPVYDRSETKLRIAKVTVSGFRGSAGEVTLDLVKNGACVDVLLWGDNGVGKSSLVDGIEFALQGRIDRSADFNSSLRSAARNLTASTAVASVDLNDGSTVSRSLLVNRAGRDEPSDLSVRPGFRIAPLVIRRADILRFLDTAALDRGAVFFDYFPDPDGALGVRPDEELKTLEEERYLLRVAKNDLATQLAEMYPQSDSDFSDTTQLNKFVDAMLEVDPELPPEVEHVVGQLRESQRRLSSIKKKLDRGVQTLNPVLYRHQLSRVVPALGSITENLTASFREITRAKHVSALRVLVAKSGPVSLDVVVDFDNGSSALPQQVFSEGYKDLIALLFFLNVTRKAAEHGQAKVLVLDDALQSVDATIRVGVMEYILREFKEWQLIVTGHDRAWLAQLQGLFARSGRTVVQHTISKWSFSEGILLGKQIRSRADSVRASLEQHDERLTAAAVGILLEEISHELSWRIESGVTRREGDRYTLGDLWPGVSKTLRGTSARAAVETISSRLDIRNLLGAHYNEWADGIAWSDVETFALAALALYEGTHCPDCASWVRKSGKSLICHCGSTTL